MHLDQKNILLEEWKKMDIEQMKRFMGLSDEEQEMEIRRMEWAKEADEEWKYESLVNILNDGPIPPCCEDPLFSVRNESDLVICFNQYGVVVSDIFMSVSMGDVYCIHCDKTPPTPREYIEEVIECAEQDYHDKVFLDKELRKKRPPKQPTG